MSSIQDPSIKKTTDSAEEVKEFFDQYFVKKISYTSNEVDSVVGFFLKRGFDKSAATAVSTVLLQQAKIENKKIFELLDSLKGYDSITLSKLVGAILNENRSKISVLGYKKQTSQTTTESRNVVL